MRQLSRSLFTATVFAVGLSAHAQGHLEIRTTVQKEAIEVSDDGLEQKTLVEAETVLPGDEVIYTVSFANVSDQEADNIVITNPLPEALSYVDGSASVPEGSVEFSVDGGTTYASPAALRVKDSRGERPARPEDYTHIRWLIAEALPPGEAGVARFRARLN